MSALVLRLSAGCDGVDLLVRHPLGYARMQVAEVCDGMEQQAVVHPPDCTWILVAEICDGLEQLIVLHLPDSA